jgi:pimeloyl-ACP methyl ester carboxylesterase
MLDARLRGHYQLWVGLYHTGNPILYSAWEIRGALDELVADLDPGRTDAALERMVVVGHSQGGLVARLLVSSSGDAFWRLLSSEPFEDYALSDEAREILSGSIFFEPVPSITRAVFISTPHRGSFLAASWIGRLARGLVEVPRHLTSSLRQLGRTAVLPEELLQEVPTSVENMEPDSRFVRVLQGLPFAPGVHLHSIVAVDGDGPVEEGDDGVVTYRSAHLDAAESELVVRYGHSCQNEPETVLELRRILLEHLQAAPRPVSPPAGGAP